MTTRKNNTSKSTPKLSTTTSPKTQPARRSRGARGASEGFDLASVDFSKMVTPGVALLASGALAAAGYLFKNEIGELAVDVLRAAAKGGTKAAHAASKAVDATRDESKDVVNGIADKISIESLLGYAGLQQRSTTRAIVGPAVGIAVGFAAGSALTYFFGQRAIELLKHATATTTTAPAMDDHAADQESDVAKTAGGSDGAHVNGGLRRGPS
jgi:hypothetical protein